MIFRDISISSKEELDPYFDIVDYEACEYCFSTLYMWQHVYKTGYYIGDGFAVLVGEYEGDSFSILPLAKRDKLNEAIDFVIEYFKKEDKKIYLRGTTKEVLEIIKKDYPNEFEYIEERDLFDYIYDAESLRSLAGRKNQKKRNHINSFIKDFEGRYEYKLLGKDDFNDCLGLMKAWTSNKEDNNEFDEGMDDELLGIKKLFENYDLLKDKLKIAGIVIDGKLEAFTLGELLNSDMAVIHIEKANPNIRGLYPFINQQFLVNEFSDVEFVNREEDLGIPGLRKAKLSYHPTRFVEKYTVREV
ncbi:MAG: phosphatidylglycerol lysyltransferase domain-containing protein [Romboutsia sp.]